MSESKNTFETAVVDLSKEEFNFLQAKYSPSEIHVAQSMHVVGKVFRLMCELVLQDKGFEDAIVLACKAHTENLSILVALVADSLGLNAKRLIEIANRIDALEKTIASEARLQLGGVTPSTKEVLERVSKP